MKRLYMCVNVEHSTVHLFERIAIWKPFGT